jgi:uncharacterized membrane protein YebE (DUF533 family)
MFNAEQMLGKMLAGALDSGSHSRSRGFGSSLASQLTSGAGLMTLIGLGVGAYEILKGQDNNPLAGPAAPPPITPAVTSPTPPPLPPQPDQIPAPPPQPPLQEVPKALTDAGDKGAFPGQPDGPALALRMIQAMIAAAAADGQIDSEEEARILQQFREQGLNREEKQILLQELQNPKTIAELTDGIHESATAQTMYSIAALAVTIDTDAERKWMDRFAQALRITPAMQRFLEDMPE